jgi:hypothetical protein
VGSSARRHRLQERQPDDEREPNHLQGYDSILLPALATERHDVVVPPVAVLTEPAEDVLGCTQDEKRWHASRSTEPASVWNLRPWPGSGLALTRTIGRFQPR